MTTGRAIAALALLAFALFMGWRFVRPLNIFVVSPAFERPISTAGAPEVLGSLKAEECATCHQSFHAEWKTSMHARAWVDRYFQVDFRFDGSQQICKNCHTPLDRQQEDLVLGHRDAEKWDPILKPNPAFDKALQSEGVTCAGCHLRNGKILGPYGSKDAPHPVEKVADTNTICLRCHVVSGKRWDTFYRFPPCGTVAEIRASRPGSGGTKPGARGGSGEVTASGPRDLGCVGCHMPLMRRPLVEDGPVRETRRHLWRGGHDPEMVRKALSIRLEEVPPPNKTKRLFKLMITNVGAGHYVPTGTPDRHLKVTLRLLDAEGQELAKEEYTIKRTIMWRPFIVDLWDTRLAPGVPHYYGITGPALGAGAPAFVEAVVRYYLVGAARLKRIGYRGAEPLSFEVYRRRMAVAPKPPSPKIWIKPRRR